MTSTLKNPYWWLAIVPFLTVCFMFDATGLQALVVAVCIASAFDFGESSQRNGHGHR